MSQNTQSNKYEIQFIHVTIIFCYNQTKLLSQLTPCSSFLLGEKLSHTTNQEIPYTLQNHRLITASQEPAQRPEESTSHPHMPSIRSILIQYSTYRPTYTYLSQAVSSFHVFQLQFYIHFSYIHRSYMLHHFHPPSFYHPNHIW